MILQSMIMDESRVTLDCAKALLMKGSIIDIPDTCYNVAEVQNAIRLGFCRVVGNPPTVAAAASATQEPTIRLRNVYRTVLSFESLKNCGLYTVAPGGIIPVPQSKMSELEISNAISWGMLVDENSPATVAQPPMRGEPVQLEELRSNDIIETTPAEYRRPAARAVGRVGDTMLAENDLTRPSEIPESVLNPDRPRRQRAQPRDEGMDRVAQAPAPAPAPKEPPKPAMSADDVFSFLDIFEGDEGPQAPPAAPAAPAPKADEVF